MFRKTTEEEARRFYERWGPHVMTFCRLFLGDEEPAEEATQQAFVAYIRSGLTAESNGVPIQLLKAALEASKGRCSYAARPMPETQELADALSFLTCEQRAVFILRSVLDLQAPWVAAITGMTAEQVNTLWMEAFMQLRQLMLGKR